MPQITQEQIDRIREAPLADLPIFLDDQAGLVAERMLKVIQDLETRLEKLEQATNTDGFRPQTDTFRK